MKRNNKALYEQIIWNVSREVKRALNEAEDNASNVMYVNSKISTRLTEDNYTEGEDPKTTLYQTDNYLKQKGSSIQELVERIADFYGCDDNIGIYDDYVLMSTITNKDKRRLSDDELELWKQGKIKAYSFEVKFNVLKQTMVTHDELVASGFESYE